MILIFLDFLGRLKRSLPDLRSFTLTSFDHLTGAPPATIDVVLIVLAISGRSGVGVILLSETKGLVDVAEVVAGVVAGVVGVKV